MSIFGKNIKKLRSLHNLSQQDFGNLFAISRGSVGSYEEGRADPKIDTLVRISKYFKISIDDLLTKEQYALEKVEMVKEVIPAPKAEEQKPAYIEDRVRLLENRLQAIENHLNLHNDH